MKRLILIMCALASAPALAGGGAGGGALEVTQFANNIQLVQAYEQQTEQLANELLRYETMLQNLKDHSLGYLSPDLQRIAVGMSKVMAASKDIGNTMARVDQNFSTQFQNPTAGTFAEKFKNWTTHSTDALKAAMLSAGLQRENFTSDTQALQKLVSNNQSADGALNAIKTLGTINAAQIQETMKLRDLLSQQHIAVGTYMATRETKEQTEKEAQTVRFKAIPLPNSGPLKNPHF